MVVNVVQAQQSAFQGTWIGESQPVDRSQFRIEISGTNWTSFFRGEIQAGGTARFSQGSAELRLANGNIYWNLTLLAPGLIEQPITMWDGYYRFRLQSPTPSQNNPPPRTSTNTMITENIFIEGIGQLTYSLSNNIEDIENAVFTRTGYTINLRTTRWDLNTEDLSQNVKTVMNRHNVNYSMTIFDDSVIINRRDGNRWFIAIYE